jgi:hypothetical protein
MMMKSLKMFMRSGQKKATEKRKSERDAQMDIRQLEKAGKIRRIFAWYLIIETMNGMLDKLIEDMGMNLEQDLEAIEDVRNPFQNPLGNRQKLTWDPNEPFEKLFQRVQVRTGERAKEWIKNFNEVLEALNRSVYV